ncbi:MAG: hypothetical protein FJY85_07745, partial [Deltaproteobacteria bacterium]|nr:hypothetical protein [Deltaproteobacteria bacterium]
MVNEDGEEYEFLEEGDLGRWEALIRGEEPLPEGRFLEMGVPSAWLAQTKLTLIDTPGINTPTEGILEVTWAAVLDCRLAMYIMTATECLTRTDLEFIEATRNYAGGFIFVITQFDRVGAAEWRAPNVQRICDDLRRRLGERGIDFLEICPTSIVSKDPEEAGITRLLNAVIEASTRGREHILSKSTALRLIPALRSEAERIESQVRLRERAMIEDSDTFRSRVAELKARLMSQRDRIAEDENRLSQKVALWRLQTLNQVTDISRDIEAQTQRGIAALRSREEAESFLKSIIWADLDNWRNRCLASLREGLSQVAREVNLSLEGVVRDISSTASEVFQADLTLWAPPLPEEPLSIQGSEGDVASDARARVLEELESLREELVQSGVSVEEIQHGLEQTRVAMTEQSYVPQYREIRQDQGAAGIERFFGGVGDFMEVAILLAPIPVGKLSFLKKFAWGAKVIKTANNLNKISAKVRSKRGKAAGRGSADNLIGKAIDWLSPAEWGRAIGQKLGQLITPDRTMVIEDEAVRRAYLEHIQPYKEREHFLQCELVLARERHSALTAKIREFEIKAQGGDQALQDLHRSASETSREILAAEEEIRFLDWKTQISGVLKQTLLDRGEGTWLSKMRSLVDSEFRFAGEQAIAALRSKTALAIDEMQRSLDEVHGLDREGAQSTERLREEMVRATLFLRETIR